ncbi:MAG: hypothetical protein K2F74_08620, partial [Muribaculaceae bacterium]|nr:hypothetical protein [Muribaculaceae bacterium]
APEKGRGRSPQSSQERSTRPEKGRGKAPPGRLESCLWERRCARASNASHPRPKSGKKGGVHHKFSQIKNNS